MAAGRRPCNARADDITRPDGRQPMNREPLRPTVYRPLATAAAVTLHLLLLASTASAQAPLGVERPRPPLVGDRPDETESAVSVPPGTIQVEAGYTAARREGTLHHTVGEILLRLGMGDRTEARIGLGSWLFGDPARDSLVTSALSDPTFGVKHVIRRSAGGTAMALLATLALHGAAHRLSLREADAELRVAAARPAGDRVELGANVFAGVPVGGGAATVGVTAVAGLDVTERVGAFAEAFASRTAGGEAQPFLDAGATWRVHRDVQLDVRAGVGLGAARGERFAGAGIIVRR
jgi:hypothetical protein